MKDLKVVYGILEELCQANRHRDSEIMQGIDGEKEHAKRSADFIGPLLLKKGLARKTVERTEFLILHHDDTGEEVESFKDNELNLLVAADSMAFFSTIAQRLYEAEGEESLRDKTRFIVDKMPDFTRNILASQKLENDIIERVKNETFKDLKK